MESRGHAQANAVGARGINETAGVGRSQTASRWPGCLATRSKRHGALGDLRASEAQPSERRDRVVDFADELDGIIAAAHEAAPEVEVVVEAPTPMDAGRRGVIGRSILEVVFSAAGGYVFGKVADAVIAQARAGWRQRHKPNTSPRPHYVKLLGPDGEVLREVKVSVWSNRRPASNGRKTLVHYSRYATCPDRSKPISQTWQHQPQSQSARLRDAHFDCTSPPLTA